MADTPIDSTRYRVVINDEEQYSIWRGDRPVPLGWHDAGVAGTRDECLRDIEARWTDMRPLSLRRAMEKLKRLSQTSV